MVYGVFSVWPNRSETSAVFVTRTLWTSTIVKLLWMVCNGFLHWLHVVRRTVLLTVGQSYVGNDVTHSTLLDRACACSYINLPKYRSYRVSNTAPWCVGVSISDVRIDRPKSLAFMDLALLRFSWMDVVFFKNVQKSKKPHSDATCDEWQYHWHYTNLGPEMERRMNEERTGGWAALVGAKLKELGTSRTHSAVIRCLTICQHIPGQKKS